MIEVKKCVAYEYPKNIPSFTKPSHLNSWVTSTLEQTNAFQAILIPFNSESIGK